MAASSSTLDKVFVQFRQSVDLLLANELALPALVLVYAMIDTLGWVDRPASKESSDRRDFMAWVNAFLLPNSGLSATAEDLYAARCAILHSHSFESTMTKSGRARRVFYSYGKADHAVLELFVADKTATDVALKIETLIAALDVGFESFKKALAADPTRAESVNERAATKFFAFVPTPERR